MKYIIAFLFIISLAHSQHPTPIPNLDTTFFNGDWYLTTYYNAALDNAQPNPITCIQIEISVDSDGGDVNQTSYRNGNPVYNNFTFDLGAENSIWLSGPNEVVWIAADPVGQSWAVGAYAKQQNAIIISRNPKISNVVTQAQLLLLKQEGYLINSTNIVTYVNKNCSSTV